MKSIKYKFFVPIAVGKTGQRCVSREKENKRRSKYSKNSLYTYFKKKSWRTNSDVICAVYVEKLLKTQSIWIGMVASIVDNSRFEQSSEFQVYESIYRLRLIVSSNVSPTFRKANDDVSMGTTFAGNRDEWRKSLKPTVSMNDEPLNTCVTWLLDERSWPLMPGLLVTIALRITTIAPASRRERRLRHQSGYAKHV